MKKLLLLPLLLWTAHANAQTTNTAVSVGTGVAHSRAVSGSVGNSNSTFSTVPKQAPAAFAPGLAAAGIETCLGSVSAAGSGAGFGLSFGTTVTDNGCNIRLYSRTLWSYGLRRAAVALLCTDPTVSAALRQEGACIDLAADPVPAPMQHGLSMSEHLDIPICQHGLATRYPDGWRCQ